jgi:WD40 repeat protein
MQVRHFRVFNPRIKMDRRAAERKFCRLRADIFRALPLRHISRRSPTAGAPNSALRRAIFGALACVAAASLSCSRQQARTSPQATASTQPLQQNLPAAPDAAARQTAPPAPSAQPQAIAAFAAATEQPQQALQAGGKPPDRVLNNGHTSVVTAIAFSPDRRRAATAADDRTIRIWDLATATEQRVLTGLADRIDALAFSPDGARLASASADGVRVWEAATGNSISAFSLPSKWAEQVAFSSDGQFLAASAGADDEGGHSYIEVHDAASGAKIHSITLDWNNATPLLITPDGRLLSSGGAGEDGEYVSTKTWELRTGRELQTWQVFVSAFSPDGRWGASLDYRQGTQISLWDLTAGRSVRTINIPRFEVARVTFTPDGTRILVTGKNFQSGPEIKFFEIATGKEVQTLPVSTGVVAFSADGKRLAAGAGSSVGIWDLAGGRELETLAGQLAAEDLAFSPDSKLLITGGSALGVWDLASGKLIRTVPGATQSVLLSPDGRWLAANPKGTLEIWDTKTWTRASFTPAAGQFVWWMGFIPPGTPSPDLSAAGLRWWQIGTGAEARMLWGSTFAAALRPDGKILATAALRVPSASNYDRPNVSIWDVASGRLLQTFAAHEVGVSGVAFSPDGKWLATSGQESRLDPANLGASLANMKHSIKLWDTSTWQERTSLEFVGTGGGLGNFSPDGRMLAVTSPNGVTLYDVPGGHAIKSLSGAGGIVRFSPDGQWLARSSGNGIALWNLSELGK